MLMRLIVLLFALAFAFAFALRTIAEAAADFLAAPASPDLCRDRIPLSIDYMLSMVVGGGHALDVAIIRAEFVALTEHLP